MRILGDLEQRNNMSLNGLTNINIELTNKCNKKCWICGRRRIEKENSNFVDFYNKEMDFELLEHITAQMPYGIVVQLHNNGEPLLYNQFGNAVKLFKNQITNIVTNGKLLLQKYDEIVNNLDTLSISVFQKDPEADEQYNIIKEFLSRKGYQKPYTTLRLIGDVDQLRYKNLNTQIITRILHSPYGSFQYEKREPVIPEIGICLDFLNHLAINIEGDVSICVRFDSNKLGVIGNLKNDSLINIWNNHTRLLWKQYHVSGNRSLVPLCETCEFWGVPTGF